MKALEFIIKLIVFVCSTTLVTLTSVYMDEIVESSGIYHLPFMMLFCFSVLSGIALWAVTDDVIKYIKEKI